MALLKITVKMPMRAAGMIIESGMSVQLATMNAVVLHMSNN